MNLYNHTTGCGLLLLVLLLSACAPVKDVINPYNEDFKCRAKDDAGKCIDTPTAYREARYPEAKEGQTESGDAMKQTAQDKRYLAPPRVNLGEHPHRYWSRAEHFL